MHVSESATYLKLIQNSLFKIYYRNRIVENIYLPGHDRGKVFHRSGLQSIESPNVVVQ